MKKYHIAATLFAILCSCSSNNEEFPTLLYSGEFISIYPEVGTLPDSHINWWSAFNPQIENKVIGYDTIVSDGSHFKDLVNYEVSGNFGNLSILTEKEEITRILQITISTKTFTEGEIGNYEIRHNGIFQKGELMITLSNFQYVEQSSAEISKNKVSVSHAFEGSAPHSYDKSIIIQNAQEEYVLNSISETQIRIEQVSPTKREIGVIEKN